MARAPALAVGMLMLRGALAGDSAEQSEQQGFLSKYITMVDKPAHQARSGFFTSARAEPLRNNMGFDTPKIIEQEEEKDMHKLLTDNDNMPTGLYAMGIALLTLVAFLGVRMRRAMNPTITLASNGAHVSNMSLPISPLSGDHNMELKAQGTAVRGQEEVLRQSSESATRKDSCKSLGWWPSSSQKSQPLTVCFAAPGDAPTSKQAMGDIDDSGARGLAAVHRRQLLGGLATSLAAPGVASAASGAQEKGLALPDGVKQNQEFKTLKGEWTRFGERLIKENIPEEEWKGVPTVLRRVYDAGDLMEYLSKGTAYQDEAKALAKDFRAIVKGVDRQAQAQDRDAVIAAYRSSSEKLARFVDLSSDVPLEL